MVDDLNLNPENFSSDEKYWLGQALTGLLAADGRLDPPERPFFSKVLKWMDTKEQTQKLMGLVKMQETPEWPKVSMEKEKALSCLKFMAQAMVANQALTKAELAFFNRIASWVGIVKDEYKKLLLYVRDCMEAGQPSLGVITSTEFTIVPCRELTRHDCAFSFHRAIMNGAFLTVELGKTTRQMEFNTALYTNCISISKDPLDSSRFLIRVEFQQPPDVRHGVLQFLEPERYKDKNIPAGYGAIETENRSLVGEKVSCFACGEKELPFWLMKPNTMKLKPNLFGVPHYLEPFPTYELCDFSKLEVTVCPKCFFSSYRIEDFQRRPEDKVPFDKGTFLSGWKEQCPDLKKQINDLPKNFGSEERTLEQTLLSYEIAIETHSVLKSCGNPKEHQWHIAMLKLRQAELNMTAKNKDAANKNLLNVENLLEPMQKHFENERAITVLTLLFLIRTYFRNNAGSEECKSKILQFSEIPDPASLHNRALREANQVIKYVQENRQKISRKAMDSFIVNDLRRDLI